MGDFFVLLIDFIKSILGKLGDVSIDFGGVSAPLLSVLVAFLIVGFCISVFWRGVRT